MSPRLLEGEYIFCSFPNSRYGHHNTLEPLASFQETEGLTLIIPKAKADEYEIAYTSTYKGITLSVHSSLEAVGLTAAFSTQLTEHGISANVIAGYYHDHIFVNTDEAQDALTALMDLTKQQHN